MDIRKWFTTSPKTTPASKPEEKRQGISKKKNNASPKKEANKSKKRRIISSDSEEDPLPTQKKQSKKIADEDVNIEAVKAEEIHKNSKSPQTRGQRKNLDSSKAEKKPVSVSDFFGSAPITRKDKKVLTKPQVKAVEENHEDEDFCKTLGKLDENDKNKVRKAESKHEAKDDSISKAKQTVTVKKTEQKDSKKKKAKSESIVKLDIIPNPVKKTTIIIDKTPPKTVAPKRRSGGANYFSYLEREGPKALGSKEIPEGEDNCLEKMSFIVTGILESMERDEAKALIEKYGGKVMTTLSKNTNYIVIGRDAGSSKLDKAGKLGTKQLDEDGLLELIRTMPGKGGAKKLKIKEEIDSDTPIEQEKTSLGKNETDLELMFMADDDDSFSDIKSPPVESNSIINGFSNFKLKVSQNAEEELDSEKPTSLKNSANTDDDLFMKHSLDPYQTGFQQKSTSYQQVVNPCELSTMWVDKYKPTTMKQLIGQQGEKCNAKKLYHWLLCWSKNRKLNRRPVHGRFNTYDDGAGYKAALLSGPPGVGKTTTSQLTCKEAGFDYLELNASDTRSKKSLQHVVSQLLGNQTLADCFKAESISNKVSQNHVIIMDEVDGMAGNEDRGGIQELISLIKASRIPIICICNDRNHPKIRSLSNHCFDLRFQKPRVEQIKAAMLTVAFKEGIKISPSALQDVIVASNHDIRQVLHNLSVWSAKESNLSAEQINIDIDKGTKHIKLGPFEVLREVFAMGTDPKASLMAKSDLFFHDYSIAPLFVQENYIHVVPTAAGCDKKKHLHLLSETANSICIGDVIDRQIRTQNTWGLLPTQSIFASVLPGELMNGHLRQMISFPSWLGKNSSRSHMDRILQELHMHMRMRVSGNKTDVALEYLPLLKRALTKPLIEKDSEGVPDVLKTMKEYYLLREDFDSIIELSLWPQQPDPRTVMSTKAKCTFTRTYNKECGANPYSITNAKKKKRSVKEESGLLGDDNEIMSDEEDESVESDAMVKVKKVTKKTAVAVDLQPKASTSKQAKKPRLKK